MVSESGIELGAIMAGAFVALFGIAYAAALAWLRCRVDYARYAWIFTAIGCAVVNAAYLLATRAPLSAWVILFGLYALAGAPVAAFRIGADLAAQHRALTETTEGENASTTSSEPRGA